jgi:hypothetical protein
MPGRGLFFDLGVFFEFFVIYIYIKSWHKDAWQVFFV